MIRAQPELEIQPAVTLRERIRTIRTARGWSQTQVSGLLDVDQASISLWEHDRIIPSGSALVALASLFRCSMEALEIGNGFVISDPPPGAGQGNLRSVSLHLRGSSPVMMVDMVDGTAVSEDLSPAIIELTDALKGSRKIWVIIK